MITMSPTSQKRPYYKLLVHLDSEDDTLRHMYEEKFKTQRDKVTKFIEGNNICVDAGVDIFNRSEERRVGNDCCATWWP